MRRKYTLEQTGRSWVVRRRMQCRSSTCDNGDDLRRLQPNWLHEERLQFHPAFKRISLGKHSVILLSCSFLFCRCCSEGISQCRMLVQSLHANFQFPPSERYLKQHCHATVLALDTGVTEPLMEVFSPIKSLLPCVLFRNSR